MTDKAVNLDFKPDNTKKKIKVLTLGDHPLSPSGVASQSKYMINEQKNKKNIFIR